MDQRQDQKSVSYSRIRMQPDKMISLIRARSRLKYYVPVLSWLPAYNIKRDLLSDFTAGLTVAFILIPGGLAYSSLVQVPPVRLHDKPRTPRQTTQQNNPQVYGLLTGFVPLIVYALLGTSRQLSLGPEALVSTLAGSAISQLNAHPNTPGATRLPETPETLAENVATASLLALMVGYVSMWSSHTDQSLKSDT